MKEIRITIRCKADAKHAKIIRVRARLGLRKAEELAELLDGTSLAYVHPPGPSSPIGHCCVCQSEVEADVSEVVDGKEFIDPEVAERKLAKQLQMTKEHLENGAAKKSGTPTLGSDGAA